MASWDRIPEEIIAEILCNLPVKSILKCSEVCKSWTSLIKTPNFIYTHLRKFTFSNTINNPQPLLLRFSDYYGCSALCFNTKVKLDENVGHIEMVLDNSTCFLSGGYCNGLICYYDFKSDQIILWNLSIRKTLTVSKLSFKYRTENLVGIGFDSNTNDFKVLRVIESKKKSEWVKAYIYSLKSDSLKDITHITPQNCYFGQMQFPIFVNGALHWIGCDEQYKSLHIVMFDVRDEVFGKIELPECLKKETVFMLCVIANGGSSIAVINSGYDIWVMKEYGVVESWVNIEINFVGSHLLERWFIGSAIFVLGITNNAEIILEDKGMTHAVIVSYDLEIQKFKDLLPSEILDGPFSFVHNYMESLTLIDRGNQSP